MRYIRTYRFSVQLKHCVDDAVIVVTTHRDNSCALKLDSVAVQLNDDGVHASVWSPGLTLRRLYVHLEAVQFGTSTGAR